MGLVRIMCMAAVLVAFPMSSWAQDEASVIILKLTRVDADDAVVAATQQALEERIEAHEALTFKSDAQVTVDELALTAGCASPDETCMKMLRDFVDADRVAFGKVQSSGDVHLFSMRMFDFAENRFVAEISDQTVEGPAADVVEIVPHVVDGFLYGNVGTLTVEVEGNAEPVLLFNGRKMGLAPTTLENLPLGQHVVTVRSGAEERSETVLLTRDAPARVSFSLTGATVADVDTGVADESRPSIVPAIVAYGIGAVGLAVGVYGGLQVQQAKDDDDRYTACVNDTGTAVDPACVSDAGLPAYSDVESKGQTGEILSFVGFGVGAVGIGLGTFLLVRALGASDAAPETAALPFELGIFPHRRGVSTSLRLRF